MYEFEKDLTREGVYDVISYGMRIGSIYTDEMGSTFFGWSSDYAGTKFATAEEANEIQDAYIAFLMIQKRG